MNDHVARRILPSATTFLLLTYAASWLIWIVTWLLSGQPTTIKSSTAMLVAVYAGSFVPGVVAGILSAAAGGGQFKQWLRGFVRWRCGWRAYVVAAVPLALALLVLTVVLGYTPHLKPNGLPAIAFYLSIFPVGIFNGLAVAVTGAGPLGEEGGWRGYLLPRLMATESEARASLIIGIAWALWHLPIMAIFVDWRGGVSLAAYLPLYLLGVIGLSFVMSRVWRIGAGSFLPCIWLHGIVNAVGGVAFDHSLWVSRWSVEASVFHFALATVLTAGVMVLSQSSTRAAVFRRA